MLDSEERKLLFELQLEHFLQNFALGFLKMFRRGMWCTAEAGSYLFVGCSSGLFIISQVVRF